SDVTDRGSRVSLRRLKSCSPETASAGLTGRRSGRRDGETSISLIPLPSKQNYYLRGKVPFELRARGRSRRALTSRRGLSSRKERPRRPCRLLVGRTRLSPTVHFFRTTNWVRC